MSLLDISGNKITQEIDLANLDLEKIKDQVFDKTHCPIGTELLGQAVQTLIEKDDVVYKLHLEFGTTTYQKRMPIHEVTVESLKTQWMDLLVMAFSNHDIGKLNRGVVIDVKNMRTQKDS